MDNYFVGGTALALINAFPPITMQGNTFYGSVSGFSSSRLPQQLVLFRAADRYQDLRPAEQVRAGRANVTIYNWDNAPASTSTRPPASRSARVSSCETPRTTSLPPVASGIYPGGVIHVPMTGLVPATPVGLATPAATGPEFQVFVLVQTTPTTSARGRIGRSPDRQEVRPLGDRSVAMKRESAPAPSAAALSPAAEHADAPPVEPCATDLPAEAPVASDGNPNASSNDRPASSLYPVVRSETSLCRASLVATNTGTRSAGLRVTYLEHETDNTNAAAISLVLNPGASLSEDDVLKSFFGLHDGHGTLEVQADDGVRVSMLSSGSPEGSSQPSPVRAVSTRELSTLRTLRGVASADVASTDVRVINPNFWGGPVAITLEEESSAAVATAFLVVPPRSDVRRGLTSLFGPLTLTSDAALSVVVDGGALPVYAFTSRRAPGSPGRTDSASR